MFCGVFWSMYVLHRLTLKTALPFCASQCRWSCFFVVECGTIVRRFSKPCIHIIIYTRARNVSLRVAAVRACWKAVFWSWRRVGFIAFGFFKLKTPFAAIYRIFRFIFEHPFRSGRNRLFGKRWFLQTGGETFPWTKDYNTGFSGNVKSVVGLGVNFV